MCRLLLLLMALTTVLAAVEPAIRWSGQRFVTAAGDSTVLRGVNLGCWLLLEPWMLRIDNARDQESLVRAWRRTLGDAGAADFRTRLRRGWITAEDLQVVRRCQFNTVRIPFDSRPLIAEEPGSPVMVQEAGFAALDEAIALAEGAGLYVILDLHGAPGGQNDDQPTGERGRNHLWTNPDAQARAAAVWEAVARRYQSHPLVIAYDLVNEPYGSVRGEEAQAVAVMDLMIQAIRRIDTTRLIFVPGTAAGVHFYGDPAARGWTKIGYTEHYYPGLYGAPETVEVHQNFLSRFIPRMAEDFRGLPFLVGEFNPVVASAGAPASTRAHFDTYARHDWAATMWALRWSTVGGGNGPSDWCLIANRDPVPPIDAATATAAEWEAWLAVTNGPRSVNETMVAAFAAPTASAFAVPQDAAVPTPATTPLPEGWTVTTLGSARRVSGGVLADGSWQLISAGNDLHAGADAAIFAHQAVPTGPWTASVRIQTLDASRQFAKGGLMLRQGLTADGPLVLVHAFPDGRTCLAVRDQPGTTARETFLKGTSLPLDLRLSWADGTVTAEARSGDQPWAVVGRVPWAAGADQHLGVVHCSNHGVIPGALVSSPVNITKNITGP